MQTLLILFHWPDLGLTSAGFNVVQAAIADLKVEAGGRVTTYKIGECTFCDDERMCDERWSPV
jgi:hypothetical protein